MGHVARKYFHKLPAWGGKESMQRNSRQYYTWRVDLEGGKYALARAQSQNSLLRYTLS